MIDLAISDWRHISLTLDEIGPFRSGAETVSFMGDAPSLEGAGQQPGPSNLYMLLARNGHGKTTILETIHGLFGLLGSPATGRFVDPTVDGRAQLDVRATWTVDGRTSTVLLSIWTGSPGPLVTWTGDRLENEAQASSWARLGLARGYGSVQPTDATDELGLLFYCAVVASAGKVPAATFGNGSDLPTILFFPADRMLVAPPSRRSVEPPNNWIYQPALSFGTDGISWNGSIENLLVWLAWIGEEQLEQALEFINQNMFDGDKVLRPPTRRDLMTQVSTGTGDHPLSGLSHGERALLQLYLRTIAHMSRNTVLLIDEVELHLHTRWTHRMYRVLKSLLRSMPTLSIVFTTHDRELIKVFDHRTLEPGLVKGGVLLDEDMT